MSYFLTRAFKKRNILYGFFFNTDTFETVSSEIPIRKKNSRIYKKSELKVIIPSPQNNLSILDYLDEINLDKGILNYFNTCGMASLQKHKLQSFGLSKKIVNLVLKGRPFESLESVNETIKNNFRDLFIERLRAELKEPTQFIYTVIL